MSLENISWERVLRALKIPYKKRLTGVLVALCPFRHEEKTPSCHFWPSGNFRCHGCLLTGDMIQFVDRYTYGGQSSGMARVDLVEFFNRLPPLSDPNTPDLPFPK